MRKMIAILVLIMCTSCAGLVPAKQQGSWLQAKITSPPEINISRSYYDHLNPPPNFWQSTVISLMNSYYSGWGIANFQQDGTQVRGNISNWNVKGVVSGKTLYLLIMDRGKVLYIAQLIAGNDGKLIGEYFEDAEMMKGIAMVLAPVP